MKYALFTYEFGAGMGHIQRLMAIACALHEKGIEPVFALPDRALGDPIVQTRLPKASIRDGVKWSIENVGAARKVETQTFADIIRLFQFDDGHKLNAAINHWQQLMDEVRPDLVVSDFSPSLYLALTSRKTGNGKTQGVPHIVVGNGYTIPPPGFLLPPIRGWDVAVRPKSRANEALILTQINELCSARKLPAVDFVADLFSGTKTFACTLAAFDPYNAYRKEAHLHKHVVRVSPFNMPDIKPGPSIEIRKGLFAFAYMPGNHPDLNAVLEMLSLTKRPCGIYVSGVAAQEVASKCGENVRVHQRPAPLDEILPQTQALIHHAGLGTATAGLMAAIPQLLLPLNLEHQITTHGVVRLDAGRQYKGSTKKGGKEVLAALEALVTDVSIKAGVERAGFCVAQEEDGAAGQARVVAACLEMLFNSKMTSKKEWT